MPGFVTSTSDALPALPVNLAATSYLRAALPANRPAPDATLPALPAALSDAIPATLSN